MMKSQDIWLVNNPASGSNDQDALDALTGQCDAAGLCLTRRIAFPHQDLPAPGELDAAGIRTVAVFAGDGTVNALVTALQGWSGAILVLPGGTMNLLSKRLHGPRSSDEIVQSLIRGDARRIRPSIVHCVTGSDAENAPTGTALAEVLAGPATAWSEAREAFRDRDIAAVVEDAIEAASQSIDGVRVHCADPAKGRGDGYPLLMVTPQRKEFSVKAYHADRFMEYAQQGMAILGHRFRDGPHEELGKFSQMMVKSADETAIPMLIDGEPVHGSGSVRFVLAECGVDLIATGER